MTTIYANNMKYLEESINKLKVFFLRINELLILGICFSIQFPSPISFYVLCSLFFLLIKFFLLLFLLFELHNQSDFLLEKYIQIIVTFLFFMTLLGSKGMIFTKCITIIIFLYDSKWITSNNQQYLSEGFFNLYTFIDDEITEEILFHDNSFSYLIPLTEKTSLKYQYTECPICLQSFTSTSTLYKLPCEHYFDDCIELWLQSHSFCPLCHMSFT